MTTDKQRPPLDLTDILVGLPAGVLIFMGMLLFSTLLGLLLGSNPWMVLLMLCLSAWLVGVLAGLFRRERGLNTALVAGITGAIFLVLVSRIAPPAESAVLSLGPVGWVSAFLLCLLGGWCMEGWRKKK